MRYLFLLLTLFFIHTVQAQEIKTVYTVSSPHFPKTSGSHKLQATNVAPKPSPTKAPVTAAGVQPVKKFLDDREVRTREIVLAHLSKYYKGDELIAADNILKKEAGYRYDAMNEQGCGGFPQACPSSKMGCPLDETGIICQADYFVGYIVRRYNGSPIQAWEFWQARVPINGKDVGNWY